MTGTFKVCSKCNESKSLDDFYHDSLGKHGVRADCKSCNKLAVRERQYRLYSTDSSFREKKKAQNRVNTKVYRGKVKTQQASIDRLRNHGLTEFEFHELLEHQKQVCGICKQDKEINSFWCVDHDHITNQIRGVLCSGCNSLLGCAKDSFTNLRQAVEYLNNPPANSILNKLLFASEEESRLLTTKTKELARYERLYGLTSIAYTRLLNSQMHACAICKLESELHVDHCHTTNKVRGLLCFQCNIMLGHAKDNPTVLMSAVDYLFSPPTENV